MGNALARVYIPDNPKLLCELSDRIILKHETDALLSPLKILDMDHMKSQTIYGSAQHVLAGQLNRDKEEAFYKRDYALGIVREQDLSMPGTVIYYIASARDILLGFYKAVTPSLGEWGFEVDRSGGGIKIIMPRNAGKLIDLANLILAKNTAEGADSPITGLDIVDFTAKNVLAEEQHILANNLSREKETAIYERDKTLGLAKNKNLIVKGTVRYYVIQVRDVLLGLNKGSEHLLGNWGFDVQHGPTPPAVKDSLKGTVTDLAGVLLADVDLLLVESSETAITNDDGKYSFPEQTPGVYTLEVSKDGYESQTIPGLDIIKDKVKIVNINLKEVGGSLFVTVRSDGMPLPDATVSIESLGLQLQTGPEGTVQFNEVPAGSYSVEATAPGKQPLVLSVNIEAGALTTMTFDLVNE